RKQDRAFFRVPLAVGAEEAEVVRPAGEPTPLALQVRDVSAGGLGIETASRLWVGEELRLKLRLPGQAGAPGLRARVVRVLQRAAASKFPWEGGAAFDELPAEVQEQLIQFALHQQRERRRRGVL